MTFEAKSGNVAHGEIKGHRGNAYVMEILWDAPASGKDITEFDDWYAKTAGTRVISKCIEDDRARAAEIDSILYGAPRN